MFDISAINGLYTVQSKCIEYIYYSKQNQTKHSTKCRIGE